MNYYGTMENDSFIVKDVPDLFCDFFKICMGFIGLTTQCPTADCASPLGEPYCGEAESGFPSYLRAEYVFRSPAVLSILPVECDPSAISFFFTSILSACERNLLRSGFSDYINPD